MILSIVLVSYNSRSEMESFFPTVLQKVRQEVPNAEFIIVDNASMDGGADYIRNRFSEVAIHAERDNLFFGPAANRGIALARGELVLLLNPDVTVDRLAFQEIASRFHGDPDLFAIHPHIRDPRDNGEERLFSLAMRRGIIDVRSPAAVAVGDARKIPFATGGAVFLRRSIFLELGGFDPLFSPFYWEDVDLGVRAVRGGFGNLFLPASRFLHWHSTIIRRNFDQRAIKVIYERNRLLFFYKHVFFLSWPFLSHCFWLLPRLLHSLAGDHLFWDGFRSCRNKFGELRDSRRALSQKRLLLSFAPLISRFRS